MNELKIFESNEFGQVRVIEINDEPWLAGRDVALALGYSNPNAAMAQHIEADEKAITNCDTPGGKQSIVFINESGLYSLILGSKLPTAKKFKKWVTSEVLPTIRKTGAYIPQELSPQLQLLINMELKQKELENSMIETKSEIQAIRENILFNPQAAWRKECNRILNAIGNQSGDYKKIKDESYNILKSRANCRPNVLVNNLKERAITNGMPSSKVAQLNILDVLENEPRLREIYVNIVKEMAIKYKVS